MHTKQLKRISNKLNYRLQDKLQLIQIVFRYWCTNIKSKLMFFIYKKQVCCVCREGRVLRWCLVKEIEIKRNKLIFRINLKWIFVFLKHVIQKGYFLEDNIFFSKIFLWKTLNYSSKTCKDKNSYYYNFKIQSGD